VIGQIRDGTTVPNDNTTWSSQPGAIRTFAGNASPCWIRLITMGTTPTTPTLSISYTLRIA
jgi:hypothetical protein